MPPARTPPGSTVFQKTEIRVSYSEVPCGAVLLDRNSPQIWQQTPLLGENTEEHLALKSTRGIWSEKECNKTHLRKAKFYFTQRI